MTGPAMQGSGAEAEKDILGCALSDRLGCAVTYELYEQYGKPIFVCRCGQHFLKVAVQGALMTGDWTAIDARHKGE